jgi:membrane-bound lytic murein transglycosylase B
LRISHGRYMISLMNYHTLWPIAIILMLSILTSCAHHEPERTKDESIQKPRQTVGNMLIEREPTPEDLNRDFVEELLVEKGLDRLRIHGLIYDPRVVIDTGFIIRNLFNTKPGASASKSQYMYYSPRFIPRGRTFIEQNREAFEGIRNRYGISPEIITAILIMESKLGTYPERYRAFRVYANLALANDPDVLVALRDTNGKRYPGLNKEKTLERARAKGRWALGELYTLVLLSDELQWDPLEIKGSIAGALGPAQFIPSTFRKYGIDGDSDGRIDPFCMADAMASIAHFLNHSGWTETGPDEKRRTALWIYNHSDIYVNTIMKLYKELELSMPSGI